MHFVVRGHVIDSTGLMTYSSTIKDLLVKLMLLLAVKHDLGIMAGGIGNEFCTAPCMEKIWMVAGNQFGNKKGSIVILKQAMYRLKIASASFHQFLGDFLREMGFSQLHADQDLWLEKSEEYKGYNYIATHVDDIIIVAKNPFKYMTNTKQHFQGQDVMDSPKHVTSEVVEVRKIASEDNFANPFTKALSNNSYHGFFHECMVNG
eukprot:14134862-Ditylum_brightwellii.AAC.1